MIMIPTTTFRWMVKENRCPTADELRSLAASQGLTMMEAKKVAINRTPPVLQQWRQAEGWEHDDYVEAGGMWEDVPLVVVPHDE